MNQTERVRKELSAFLTEDQILTDEPMSRHTTFRIGGPASLFVLPKAEEELRQVLTLLTQEGVPFFILGNGSNLLVSDEGYRGVVVQIARRMNQIQVEGTKIRAQAGAQLSAIAAAAAGAGLSGFEFASGIPGTLGGACVMNAGAYGGEMKDVLTSVAILDQENRLLTLPAEELALGYRTSRIKTDGYTVVSAEIRLQPGDEAEIRAMMKELNGRRLEKQPLEYPSAGSTFKRPEGMFAGKLIMDAGLRGFSVGGAQVAEKHCGFVINKGGATAADVQELIRQVIARVEEAYGVTLEPEIKFLGEF